MGEAVMEIKQELEEDKNLMYRLSFWLSEKSTYFFRRDVCIKLYLKTAMCLLWQWTLCSGRRIAYIMRLDCGEVNLQFLTMGQ